MNLQIIDPISYPGWDEMLIAGGDESFFHTSAWARVLADSYNYKPLYFTRISEGRLSALFPFMEVNSFLTGKRGVSLPFTDFCDPIANDADTFRQAMDHVMDHGRTAGWKYIDFRGGKDYLPDVTPSLTHYTHDLQLNRDEKNIFNNFKDNTRRNIKKAIKEGVEVQISNSLESIKEFFKLNCITKKKHHLPPQPFRFFNNIHEHIISKKKGFLSVAIFKKKVIAANVFFHFGKRAIYKYGASDISYSHLRPNNLVMWEAIKWYLNNGFTNFSFGITEQENEGLLQFKRSWGAEEETVNYYKYDLRKEAFVKDKFRGRTSYAIFRHMPLPFLNMIGSIIYRHFG